MPQPELTINTLKPRWNRREHLMFEKIAREVRDGGSDAEP